jgi:hypothetical protein
VHNARLSRACYRLPLQPIVPERESAREGIIALGSAGRSRSAQRFGNEKLTRSSPAGCDRVERRVMILFQLYTKTAAYTSLYGFEYHLSCFFHAQMEVATGLPGTIPSIFISFASNHSYVISAWSSCNFLNALATKVAGE